MIDALLAFVVAVTIGREERSIFWLALGVILSVVVGVCGSRILASILVDKLEVLVFFLLFPMYALSGLSHVFFMMWLAFATMRVMAKHEEVPPARPPQQPPEPTDFTTLPKYRDF